MLGHFPNPLRILEVAQPKGGVLLTNSWAKEEGAVCQEKVGAGGGGPQTTVQVGLNSLCYTEVLACPQEAHNNYSITTLPQGLPICKVYSIITIKPSSLT